ncbi:MAG: CHAP domain-containing protein [Deltaproteobacteria bacterium]|nr:CHAP domain-containing protein [Deltaproteobacteria bacterium]MBW2254380.1 CHAP domain-containing protein [Deltaproteobacteria bacterium]
MLPLLLLFLSGCVHGPRIPGPLGPVGRAPLPAASYPPEPIPLPPSDRPPPERQRPDPFGAALADAASFYLEHEPKHYRRDCSGFVCAAAARAGWPVQGNTQSLWDLATEQGRVHHRKEPGVGDLAFFDQTYDRNRDGRLNDELTHVAVVIGVEEDGTVVLAHSGTRAGRTELRMNLRHPHDHTDPLGKEINGWLRQDLRTDPPGTPHLAAECWRAFATLSPATQEAWETVDGS